MVEVWKDIQGFEGLYKISNLGNVKSLNYRRMGYEKDLTPKVNNYGRLWVELRNNGKKKQMLIHRLVGEAFIPNPNNLPQINHKDENTKNNCVENLEWCTNEYNIRYFYERHPERHRNPLRLKRKQTSRTNRDLSGRKILQMDSNGNIVKEWENCKRIVRQTGMNQWSITQCCDGKRKTAYGFRWQYAI